jgi:predicted amidohydrolase YtcJ
MMKYAAFAFLIISINYSLLFGQTNAELLIYGGPIYSVDSINSLVEAVAVSNGRILATGDYQDLEQLINNDTRMLDLKGNTMIPGFIESHAHLLALGKQKRQMDLTDIGSYDELLENVRIKVSETPKGEWILGRGWHQSKWNPQPEMVTGYQTHERLSQISPDHPIVLSHASGHALFANEKAMDMANISSETSFGEYGEIIRDDAGKPTGIFTENAMSLITQLIPEDSHESIYLDLIAGIKECTKHGITSFQDAGSDAKAISAYRKAVINGEMNIRLWAMLSCSNNEPTLNDSFVESWLAQGPEIGEKLTIRSIKLYSDGALGSRGAWLIEEYSDRPGHFGNPVQPMTLIAEVADKGLKSGFQVCTHAIGDRANREVLDAYEKAFAANPEKAADHRFRIEHAQHLHPQDIPRFAEMRVIASMQGIHFASDRPWAIDRLGALRIALGAYRWKQFLESGAVVINGTDSPVEPLDPLACFYTTVTRRTRTGSAFEVDQKLSREDALRTYTINAAYAAFEEDVKGTIEEGKYADFTILSDDLLRISDEELLNLEVLQTIVGGKTVYTKSVE